MKIRLLGSMATEKCQTAKVRMSLKPQSPLKAAPVINTIVRDVTPMSATTKSLSTDGARVPADGAQTGAMAISKTRAQLDGQS